MTQGVFTKILISVCYNLIYVFCIVKLYLCSLSGLLKSVQSGLTSLTSLDAPLWFFTLRVLIVLKKRDFNFGCFSYYKAEIKLHFVTQNLNQLL